MKQCKAMGCCLKVQYLQHLQQDEGTAEQSYCFSKWLVDETIILNQVEV